MLICDHIGPEERNQLLRTLFSQGELTLLNDGLNCLFRHPEDWGFPEEGVPLLRILAEFDFHGFNTIKEEYDPLRNPQLFHDSFKASLRHDWQRNKEEEYI